MKKRLFGLVILGITSTVNILISGFLMKEIYVYNTDKRENKSLFNSIDIIDFINHDDNLKIYDAHYNSIPNNNLCDDLLHNLNYRYVSSVPREIDLAHQTNYVYF